MNVRVRYSRAAQEAVDRVVPRLVDENIASAINGQDPTLWGPDAEAEAEHRLGWTDAVAVSRPLVEPILRLREELHHSGLRHVVLCGTGGSSLGAELIAQTAGAHLTVIDSSHPVVMRSAVGDRLAQAVVVVSSKSGSTIETDSQRRCFEQAFIEAGIDPAARIIVVTDPDTPLAAIAEQRGYRLFVGDPEVGGRYSALTAFGLVPAGLAGADIAELLDEAEAVEVLLAVDTPENPGLALGAAIAAQNPRRDTLGLIADGTHLRGFCDWAEQLVAESTGKLGTGILPVVLAADSPEVTAGLPDMQIVRFVENALADHDDAVQRGEVLMSGTLGGMLLVWQYAVAVAARLLGVDPFDQPDVESAKAATVGLLESGQARSAPAFVVDGVEVRIDGLPGGALDLRQAFDRVIEATAAGYIAIQAFVDPRASSALLGLRDELAARSGRPVTFGWGPRYLHSTGQYHKGGAQDGVFVQITDNPVADLEIPDRPFTLGELMRAQADGDAAVLAAHGRPVLRCTLLAHDAGDALVRAGARRVDAR